MIVLAMLALMYNGLFLLLQHVLGIVFMCLWSCIFSYLYFFGKWEYCGLGCINVVIIYVSCLLDASAREVYPCNLDLLILCCGFELPIGSIHKPIGCVVVPHTQLDEHVSCQVYFLV